MQRHSHTSGPRDERRPGAVPEAGRRARGGRPGAYLQAVTLTEQKGQCQSCARRIVHFIKPVFIKKPIQKVWKA